MSTTCTGHGRGKDDVWEVAGTVVSKWEQGEDAGWSQATGTGADFRAHVGMAVHTMDMTGGMDAVWSGLCSDDLDPGKAWSCSVK